MPRLRTPSPALCVALLALFVALGGTTWAALSLPPNSVGTRQLMRDAVNGQKVRNHSLTGADIALSTLGAVPSARNAAHAASADLATHATAAPESPPVPASFPVDGVPLSLLLQAASQPPSAPADLGDLGHCDGGTAGSVDCGAPVA